MTVLITGCSGFVGQNLIAFLSGSDASVKKMDRSGLLQADSQSLTGCDAVVHLAGKAHDLKKTANPQEYYEVNFELTKKLYDAFLVSDAKTFIFVSSVKAAADVVKGNSLSEEVIPEPKTDYGKSKLMAEQYIQSTPLPEGKSYYILRPCMIHGPGNKGNLNLLYQVVKKGIPYPLAAFDNKRSFLSVQNLCFVIGELITQKEVPVGIYNVADDTALSTTEVVTILSESTGKKARLWKIPAGLIKSAAKLGDTLKLPLNTERLNKLTESYVVSNAKIVKALNTNLPVKSREGLKSTADSFKNS
jgi:nucleoside-diphosphate-sugar epimerase